MLAPLMEHLPETVTAFLVASVALSGASVWAIVRAVRAPEPPRSLD